MSRTTVSVVDDAGVHVRAGEDTVVDVLFDGRRIWSFWTGRDTRDGVAGWPPMLKRFLNGVTQISVVEHVTGTVVYDEEVHLGRGRARIAVVDPEGRPLGIDKSNRIATTFDTRDAEHTRPLLDSTEKVLAALAEAGVEAFPAYGTLLGASASRTSSATTATWTSATSAGTPIRSTWCASRSGCSGRCASRGSPSTATARRRSRSTWSRPTAACAAWTSSAATSSTRRSTCWGRSARPFRKEWIFPLGTCTLAGRTLPAPARPEKLLEATYGPGWKVPDPAFHFETPRTTVRRLNGWFRGIRIHRNEWDRRYSRVRDKVPPLEPSALAAHVAEHEQVHRLVDVGAGRGADALWFARQGVPTIGLDYAWGAAGGVRRLAEQEGLDLRLDWMNLHETRTVLAHGARIARLDGPVTMLANHLVDSTDRRGLEALARLARMSLSGGGRLYADFDALRPGETYRPGGPRDAVRPQDPDRVGAVLAAARSRYRAQHCGDDARRRRRAGASGGETGGPMVRGRT